jgi:DNA-binding transcriptional regulator YiaG
MQARKMGYSVDAIARTIYACSMAKDFLAEIVSERTRRNPGFPELVAEAEERRRFARKLAALREKTSLSQTVVAARMGTSPSVVSKLEAGGDVKMSTLQRYCAAIGQKFRVAV